MTEVYRVNYRGYLTTRRKASVLTNETNLAAVLMRCQTKGTVYVSGNTKIVRQRNSVRAGSPHFARAGISTLSSNSEINSLMHRPRLTIATCMSVLPSLPARYTWGSTNFVRAILACSVRSLMLFLLQEISHRHQNISGTPPLPHSPGKSVLDRLQTNSLPVARPKFCPRRSSDESKDGLGSL